MPTPTKNARTNSSQRANKQAPSFAAAILKANNVKRVDIQTKV